jgi:hypothetical protein
MNDGELMYGQMNHVIESHPRDLLVFLAEIEGVWEVGGLKPGCVNSALACIASNLVPFPAVALPLARFVTAVTLYQSHETLVCGDPCILKCCLDIALRLFFDSNVEKEVMFWVLTAMANMQICEVRVTEWLTSDKNMADNVVRKITGMLDEMESEMEGMAIANIVAMSRCMPDIFDSNVVNMKRIFEFLSSETARPGVRTFVLSVLSDCCARWTEAIDFDTVLIVLAHLPMLMSEALRPMPDLAPLIGLIFETLLEKASGHVSDGTALSEQEDFLTQVHRSWTVVMETSHPNN